MLGLTPKMKRRSASIPSGVFSRLRSERMSRPPPTSSTTHSVICSATTIRLVRDRAASVLAVAAEVFSAHLSQGGEKILADLANNTLTTSSDAIAKIATGPVRLILGKSLVPSAVTGDVLTGVKPEGIAFQRPPGYVAAAHTEPTLEIGDPWSYYHKLW